MKVLCDKLKAMAQVFGVDMSSVTRSDVAISQEVQVPQNALPEVVSRSSEPDSPRVVDGFDFWIDDIEFVDGMRVTVRRGSIVVLIGANNTGKSTVLRDVKACVVGNKGRLLRSVGTHAAGSREQLLDWFTGVGVEEHANYWSGWECEVTKINSPSWPDAGVYRSIASALVGLATTSSRLAAASEVEAHDVHREGPTNLMQALLENETVERSIDESVQKVFGTRVVLDRTSGRRVMFRCGNIPEPSSGEDRVSSGYRRVLSGFPRLDDAGDGLKSFVSVCMWLEVGPWFVRLIDEPEAFLHPPQARALGAKLSAARLNGPLFVATHSGDLLRGILDSSPRDLQLLRLTRRGDSCAVHKVKTSAVSEFQMDPSVMATSAVDGLFHEGVVICEGEGDCQFYRAMLAAASVGRMVTDLHFISVGGKQNAWKFARFYRSVGVPCVVVVDTDILNDRSVVRTLVESLGGDYSLVRDVHERLMKSVGSMNLSAPRVSDIRDRIMEVLGIARSSAAKDRPNGSIGPNAAVGQDLLTRDQSKKIQALVKVETGWSNLKEGGIMALPSGQPISDAENLIAALARWGVLVLKVGQLEGFYKKASGHGPSWMTNVLALNLVQDADLADARAFALEIAASVATQMKAER